MRYLKEVIIENFQSHQLTRLQFGPELNVVVGPSDQGKSAIIRAIRWVLFNEPRGMEFIRVGSSEARVTLIWSDGSSLSRERGQRKNRYVLQRPGQDPVVLEGFGVEVPLEVRQLSGIEPLQIDKDTCLNLHLGQQLEAPFLLEGSGIGQLRAKAIGRLSGVHIIDAAQSSLASEVRRLQQLENRLSGEKEQLELQLQAYQQLEEEQTRLQKVQEQVQLLEGLEQTRVELEKLLAEWQDIQQRLSAGAEFIKKVSQGVAVRPQLAEAEQRAATYEQLKLLSRDWHQLQADLQALAEMMAATARVTDLRSRWEQMLALEENYRGLARLEKAWRELETDLQNLVRELQPLNRLNQTRVLWKKLEQKNWQVLELKDLLLRWQQLEQQQQDLQDEAEQRQLQIQQLVGEYVKRLKQLGRCPTCLQLLPEQAISEIAVELSRNKEVG